MDRIKLPFEHVLSAGYDSKNKIMEIELNPEGIIQYFNVPEKAYTGLLNAKSDVEYYIKKIKYIYPYKKIAA